MLETITLAFKGKCPQCKRASVFQGFFRFKKNCDECGCDFDSIQIGDAAAYSTMFIVGFFLTAFMAYIEFKYTPPLWIHAIILTFLSFILSLGLLRFFRGLWLILEWSQSIDSKYN
jgi:uncharacterized protein (DUF983 family)